MSADSKEQARNAARDLLTARGFTVAKDVEIYDDHRLHPVEVTDTGAWVTCRIFVPNASPPEAHVAAAKAIIQRWVEWMKADPAGMVQRNGRTTVREWLEAASEHGNVLHDNCDANMLFQEVLVERGLIPEDHLDDDRWMDTWNSVTANHRLLEHFASELVRGGTS